MMIIDKTYIEEQLKLSKPSHKKSFSRSPLSSVASHSRFKTKDNHLESPDTSSAEVQDDLCADAEKAFRKIELLLSVRDRSVREISTRLIREKYTQDAISESIDRALRCGYLNDERFADCFIRSKLRASKGIPGIIRDLKDHGIDATLIPGFPDKFLEDSGSQLENAIRLLQRKPPRAKNQRQAAYAKLIRNGYSSNIASQAVRAWIEESEKSMHFS